MAPEERGVLLDHLGYIRERRHRRAVLFQVRKLAAKGKAIAVYVAHEPEDECCVIQPWLETLGHLREQLASDGLASALMVRITEEDWK
jgi:hypothetical protein